MPKTVSHYYRVFQEFRRGIVSSYGEQITLLNEIKVPFELSIERCSNGEVNKSPGDHQEKAGHPQFKEEAV